jgi:enediyne biosynthesis protein E4
VPFLAAVLLAMRLNRGPSRAPADAAHPGFVLRDETAVAGIDFVHRRPSFDPKIANIEAHVAALGASVSVADFDGDGAPDLYFTNSRFGERNALYRNRGDGTFEEVATSAGLADLNRPGDGVSMGAVWGDAAPAFLALALVGPVAKWLDLRRSGGRTAAPTRVRSSTSPSSRTSEASVGI